MTGSVRTVTAHVYNRTFTSQLAALDDSFQRQWRSEISEPGSGKCALQNDDSDLAHCAYQNIVRFSLDGTPRFAMLIEQKKIATISQSEEVGQFTLLEGRGIGAIMEDAVVYPPLGVGRVPFADVRVFNWASPEFDDSAWGAPVATDPLYGQVVNGVVTERFALPADWPAADAEWIWDRDSSSDGVPAGDVYFRATFNLGSSGQYQVWAAADDAYEVWVDGVRMLSETPFYIGQSRHTATFTLDSGDHYVAIKGTNSNALKAGILAAVVPIAVDGTKGTPVLQSDETNWVVLGYPATVPGFTPGGVLVQLIDEAQTRGSLDGLTITFDAADDTASDAWPEAGDIVFTVGLDYLSVLRQLAETYIDWSMSADALELNCWNIDGMGTTTAVAFIAPTDPNDPLSGNLAELIHEGVG